MRVTSVKFIYYYCYETNKSTGKEKIFDFEDWECDYLKGKDPKDTICNMGDLIVRMDKRKKENDFIKLQFMRLRDDMTPYIVNLNRNDSEEIELESDEFVGEATMVLYDVQSKIFMIQVNKFGLSPKAIEMYLSETFTSRDISLEFKPFKLDDKSIDVSERPVSELEISLANTNADAHGGSLKKFMNHFSDMNSKVLTLKFSLSYETKNKDGSYNSLNQKEVQDIVDEISDNSSEIRTAKIKYRDENDKMQYVDLLNNIIYSHIKYEIESKKALAFEYATDKMENKFMEDSTKLLKCTN